MSRWWELPLRPDPRGHTTYYEYDDAGRLVRVKEGEKTTTLYKYHYRNE